MNTVESALSVVREQIGRVERMLAEVRSKNPPNNHSALDAMAASYSELLEELHADLRRLEEKKAALALADPVPVEAN